MKKFYFALSHLDLMLFIPTLSCDSQDPIVWECVVDQGVTPVFTQSIGCESDFNALASQPPDASIPGAMSVKENPK